MKLMTFYFIVNTRKTKISFSSSEFLSNEMKIDKHYAWSCSDKQKPEKRIQIAISFSIYPAFSSFIIFFFSQLRRLFSVFAFRYKKIFNDYKLCWNLPLTHYCYVQEKLNAVFGQRQEIM